VHRYNNIQGRVRQAKKGGTVFSPGQWASAAVDMSRSRTIIIHMLVPELGALARAGIHQDEAWPGLPYGACIMMHLLFFDAIAYRTSSLCVRRMPMSQPFMNSMHSLPHANPLRLCCSSTVQLVQLVDVFCFVLFLVA
jgi:hypothetical protein